MPQKYSPGDVVYGTDGKSYTVEVIDGKTAYCVAPDGTETEIPVDMLSTQSAWSETGAKTKPSQREISYSRLRQSRHFLPATTKISATAADQLLSKANVLVPSLLDFVAFSTAEIILTEHKEDDLIDQLSIMKSRAVFDDVPSPVRARVLAEFLDAQPDALASAAGLGDNLLRAMIEKGLAKHEAAFDAFQDRPRK